MVRRGRRGRSPVPAACLPGGIAPRRRGLPPDAGVRRAAPRGRLPRHHKGRDLRLPEARARRRAVQPPLRPVQPCPPCPSTRTRGRCCSSSVCPSSCPSRCSASPRPSAGTTIIGFRHEKAGHHTQVVPSRRGFRRQMGHPRLARTRQEAPHPRMGRTARHADDSMAIYSRLPGHPNVTLVNTHSAVTMAAAHTRLLPDFILGGELPETAQGMTLKRFGYFVLNKDYAMQNASHRSYHLRRAADGSSPPGSASPPPCSGTPTPGTPASIPWTAAPALLTASWACASNASWKSTANRTSSPASSPCGKAWL